MVRTSSKTIRNGFKWRAGRPRWEPSRANRLAGLKGRDLKDGRRWLDRGEAIDACDARHLWAGLVRLAKAGDAQAHADLERALDQLQPPLSDAERLRRDLLADLLSAAQGLSSAPRVAISARTVLPTVQQMVDGYFARPPRRADPRGIDPPTPPEASTLRAYKVQSAKLLAKFGERAVAELTIGDLRAWYLDLCTDHSLPTANLAIGAAGAFFRWATWQQPPWITSSPVSKIGRSKAAGRIVFWTVPEEQGFIPWCDANGYADVADGVTLCLWTGARPIDACKAPLDQLAGATWRFTPWKTRRKGREALPGLLQPVKDRVERRRLQAVTGLQRTFLLKPTGGVHTTASLGERFREAKVGALAAGAVPASFEGKRLADTRDTCLSRLAWAGVSLDRIPPWTGHSRKSAEEILREHYLALREEGAIEDAAQLEAWAVKEGMGL